MYSSWKMIHALYSFDSSIFTMQCYVSNDEDGRKAFPTPYQFARLLVNFPPWLWRTVSFTVSNLYMLRLRYGNLHNFRGGAISFLSSQSNRSAANNEVATCSQLLGGNGWILESIEVTECHTQYPKSFRWAHRGESTILRIVACLYPQAWYVNASRKPILFNTIISDRKVQSFSPAFLTLSRLKEQICCCELLPNQTDLWYKMQKNC